MHFPPKETLATQHDSCTGFFSIACLFSRNAGQNAPLHPLPCITFCDLILISF